MALSHGVGKEVHSAPLDGAAQACASAGLLRQLEGHAARRPRCAVAGLLQERFPEWRFQAGAEEESREEIDNSKVGQPRMSRGGSLGVACVWEHTVQAVRAHIEKGRCWPASKKKLHIWLLHACRGSGSWGCRSRPFAPRSWIWPSQWCSWALPLHSPTSACFKQQFSPFDSLLLTCFVAFPQVVHFMRCAQERQPKCCPNSKAESTKQQRRLG